MLRALQRSHRVGLAATFAGALSINALHNRAECKARDEKSVQAQELLHKQIVELNPAGPRATKKIKFGGHRGNRFLILSSEEVSQMCNKHGIEGSPPWAT